MDQSWEMGGGLFQEVGCADGGGGNKAWRMERWETEMQTAVVSSFGEKLKGGVSYSKRGEEIIFFGSLKRMMK